MFLSYVRCICGKGEGSYGGSGGDPKQLSVLYYDIPCIILRDFVATSRLGSI